MNNRIICVVLILSLYKGQFALHLTDVQRCTWDFIRDFFKNKKTKIILPTTTFCSLLTVLSSFEGNLLQVTLVHLWKSCNQNWLCVVVFCLWEAWEREMRVCWRGHGGTRIGNVVLLFFWICDLFQFFIRWVFLIGHQAVIFTCHFLFWIWAVTNSERGETMRTGGDREETFQQEAGSEDANMRPYLMLAASRLDMV